jgi:hypothetical protein
MDNTVPWLRTSTSVGASATFDASDYNWVLHGVRENGAGAVTPAERAQNSDTEIELYPQFFTLKLGNGAGEHFNLDIHVFSARNPSLFTLIRWELTGINSSGNSVTAQGTGYRRVVEDNKSIRLLMDTGNIQSGTFILMGLKGSN